MVLNLLFLVVGLLICFAGIYLRRVCAGILGFVWGVLASFWVILLIMGVRKAGEDGTLVIMLFCGIVTAAISAIYYKACAAINGFMSAFSFSALFLILADIVESSTSVILISAVIGLIVAVICYKFYDYSFITITALSGGFVASIGGFCLIEEAEIDELLMAFLWFGPDEMSPILIGTIVLGIIGFIVQLQKLKKVQENTQ